MRIITNTFILYPIPCADRMVPLGLDSLTMRPIRRILFRFLTILAFFALLTTYSYAAPINSEHIPDDNIHNSTNSEVIVIYPLSGYYAPLQRALYWSIIVFTIVGLGNVWLVTAAFGTAMTYSSVAAVHAIAIYAVRSREYYDSDSLAIWEILFCTSVLLPSWLAHYKRLRSTTAQIVLRLWGALMFMGGVITICQLTIINDNVIAHPNDCIAKLPTNITAFNMVDWHSQTICSWQPYENATQPMRDINEVIIARSSHQLARWTGTLGTFAACAGTLCISFMVCGFLWPESKSLEKHREAQLKKLRKHKRAKGNHPADTCQMPIAWCVGIVTLVLSEIVLHLVPVSEGLSAVGQWGPWVAVIFVLVAVLINHYFEAPTEEMTAALGKVLGPLIWFELDWRGKAPSRRQQQQAEKARKEAEREEMERARRSRMRTTETQTEDLESADLGVSTVDRRKRRFSESDVGVQQIRLDSDLVNR